jgi:hypothetical protein
MSQMPACHDNSLTGADDPAGRPSDAVPMPGDMTTNQAADEVAGIPPKELPLDVCTRWNSTHDMIVRALELCGPLDAMAGLDLHLFKYKLTAEEWQLLEDSRKIFRRASKYLSATSHPTLATAVPVYNFMMDELEDYRDTSGCPDTLKAATDAAIGKLKVYYSKTGAEIYPVATILDPRFKLRYYCDHGWEDVWIQEARRMFKAAYARYRASLVPDVRTSAPIGGADNRGASDDDDDLMSHFAKRRRIVREELEEYLAAPLAVLETDILQWWKANTATYPCLAAMARDYLAIPATSVPVECVFSGGTDLVQPKRGSLSEDTIRACMCLKSRLKLPQ